MLNKILIGTMITIISMILIKVNFLLGLLLCSLKLILLRNNCNIFGKIKEINLNLLIIILKLLKLTLLLKKDGGSVLMNNGSIFLCLIVMLKFSTRSKRTTKRLEF